MKEVIRSADPRVAALIERQATQYRDRDQLGLDRIAALLETAWPAAGSAAARVPCRRDQRQGIDLRLPPRRRWRRPGKRVHAFTSPHLVRYNERIRIAGKLIDDEQLAELMSRVLDANDEIGASLFEVNTAVAFLAFAETAGRRLHPGSRARRTARRDQCHRAAAGLRDRQPRPRPPGVPRQHDDRSGRAKRPGSPSAACRWSPSYTRPQLAERIGEIAHDVGAIWEPRGLHWDAIVRQGKLRYRDRQGELDLPLPRLPGKHQALNAALAVAMLRHQSQLAIPPSALSAAMGWAQLAGAAAAAARRTAVRHAAARAASCGSTAAIIPARRGWSPTMPARIGPTACRWCCCSPACRARMRPERFGRSRGSPAEVLTLPIDGHECRSPEELAHLAESMGLAGRAHARAWPSAMTALAQTGTRAGLRLALPGRRAAVAQRAAAGLALRPHRPGRRPRPRRPQSPIELVDQARSHHQPEQDDSGQARQRSSASRN